jgi:hypothetical protein
VCGAQADDQVHVIAQYPAFNQVSIHFTAFGFKEAVQKSGYFVVDEWLPFASHKNDGIVQRIAVVIGFVLFV